MKIAVVAGGVSGKLGENLGGVDQFAVAEGVAEGDWAVVGVRGSGIGGGLGEKWLGNGVVGVVEESGLEDAEAVASLGRGDHVVDQELLEMPDRLELAVVAARVTDKLFAVLAGEEDFVGKFPVAGGILSADGFSFGRKWAGGFLRVLPVGCELSFRGHWGFLRAGVCHTGWGKTNSE